MEKSIIKRISEYALTDPFRFNELSWEMRNDVLLMRKIAGNDGVSPIIMYYVGEDVQNDLLFHLRLLEHSEFSPFDYVMRENLSSHDDEYELSLDLSDFGNSFIGLEVRTQRVFWELLNEKLAEVGYKYPYYNVGKEVTIATEEIESSKKNTIK